MFNAVKHNNIIMFKNVNTSQSNVNVDGLSEAFLGFNPYFCQIQYILKVYEDKKCSLK